MTLLSFGGSIIQNSQILLEWMVDSDEPGTYNIERSKDGRDFKTIGTLENTELKHEVSQYNWVDQEPESNFNFYRLKRVSTNGVFDYSKIILVKLNALFENGSYKFYPNPTKGKLFIQGDLSEIRSIKVLNSVGQNYFTPVVDNYLETNVLMPGVYSVVIEDINGKVNHSKIMVQ